MILIAARCVRNHIETGQAGMEVISINEHPMESHRMFCYSLVGYSFKS